MTSMEKGKSPFYPGQPVPVELFVGRQEEIDRLITRGVKQVAQGKPVAVFIVGEYGIGKSSIAGFVQWVAQRDHGLHSVYANLGGAQTLEDVARAILEATIRSGTFDPSRSDRIRNWLAKYIGKQGLFGITLNMDALRRDAPTLSTPFGLLEFLNEAQRRLADEGVKGIFLVLDEINGITGNEQFAHFLKGLVDANAMSEQPLPLMLLLCGVEERRREMIKKHEPVARIFEVVAIELMTKPEMEAFFDHAFESVQMGIDADAMELLAHYAAGFPKIMHILGDAAYWTDNDGFVTELDAIDAIILGAEEVGRKYVDQQVYSALRSPDYHSILQKIAAMGPDSMSFTKKEVAAELTNGEKKKFNNFLQKMKNLQVLHSGDVQGEYVFNVRMVRFYIWLQSLEKKK